MTQIWISIIAGVALAGCTYHVADDEDFANVAAAKNCRVKPAVPIEEAGEHPLSVHMKLKKYREAADAWNRCPQAKEDPAPPALSKDYPNYVSKWSTGTTSPNFTLGVVRVID